MKLAVKFEGINGSSTPNIKLSLPGIRRNGFARITSLSIESDENNIPVTLNLTDPIIFPIRRVFLSRRDYNSSIISTNHIAKTELLPVVAVVATTTSIKVGTFMVPNATQLVDEITKGPDVYLQWVLSEDESFDAIVTIGYEVVSPSDIVQAQLEFLGDI